MRNQEMTRNHASALFLLAGITVKSLHEIPNGYWPDAEGHYQTLRRDSPWWLAITPAGPIQIGWRKKVISIDWRDSIVRAVVTEDDVTREDTYVHAWSVPDALKYLISWRLRAALALKDAIVETVPA